MNLRPLGTTGLQVSPLGLGTVKLGRTQQVKYPEPFELPDDESARALLKHADRLGINLIDTAPAYGVSEERLGALLSGWRDSWVICTKVGEEFEAGESKFDFSPEWARSSVERSLRRLHTDVLDIVLVHSNGDDLQILNEFGTLDALRDLKDEGKLRSFGLSTKTPEGARIAAERCDVIMVTLNLHSSDDVPAIELADRRGTGVLVKKALASGHAASHPVAGTAQDPIEASFRHVFDQAGVSSAIVGTINPEHLSRNVSIVESLLHGHG